MNSSFLGILTTSRAPAVAAATIPPPIPDILRWKLDEGSGTGFGATVGPGGGMTVADWTSDTGSPFSPWAIFFEGTGHFGVSSSSVDYFSTSVITLSFWLKPNAQPGFRVIFQGNAFNSSSFDIFSNESDLFAARVFDSGGRDFGVYTILTLGTRYHLVAVLDNSTSGGAIKMYVNGIQISPVTFSTAHTTPTTFANDLLYLAPTNGGNFTCDMMDDICIFDRELSAAEVLALYNANAQ